MARYIVVGAKSETFAQRFTITVVFSRTLRGAGVGENAAGIDPTKPKVQIKVDGQTRVPDRLENGFLDEVKNVKQQSFTKQLRDFHKYSIDNGLKMRLYLPNWNTPVSGPLQQQFNNGTIIRMSLNF